ncbi:MAG: Gfo/Idh/MocA family oxidoreductase [Planctomycetaceae bacterium]
MNRLNLAVIGAGALGRHHARIVAGLDDVELVAVVDPHPQNGPRVASEHGARWVDDHRDLYEALDGVVIAAPTTLHLEIGAHFLERGIPVLIEKPIAADLAQSRELVRLAELHDTILQAGHVERFNPAWRTARPTCDEMGDAPRYIRAERVAPFTFRSTDVGVVLDVMIHDIDLVLDLLGETPLERVEALGAPVLGEHEDVVQARLTFADGSIADLAAGRIFPEAKRTMQVWSADAVVTIDFAARTVSTYGKTDRLRYGESPLEAARQPGADIERLKQCMFGDYLSVARPAVVPGDALTAELEDFIRAIRTGTSPLVDGRTALAGMQIVDRILTDVHRRRASVPHAARHAA